ncbi:uncharacterized protein LOC122384523 [Amphibalanus amphitrite]|nr:uncharacterized protein LOC122384523 [Amphibalanus amphitrite]XP_043227997.1 uncharacterized protein LOC122384523 [Amphibalanus amphitrite]
MASGYFRGTPCHTSTIFSLEVFHLWRNLKSLSPGTSLAAFAMSLEKMGQLGGTCAPVDPERFQKAYSEWSYMVFEARRVVGHEDFQCHACGPKPMCVHVDGNGKLYRFKSAGGDTDRRPYHDGSCIASKEDVDAHVERLASIGKVSTLCGASTWSAARNSSSVLSARRSQDVTGLCLATCRHSVVLSALDMYRGEIYAYAHFLHQFRFPNVPFFAYDVVCQYWKWLQDVHRKMPELSTQSLPYLSVMHATGHSYHCQITYGGFWQEGSGWSVMETTEIANAHLSRAGNTTKHMSRAQRVDELTDQILYWNARRRERLSRELTERLQRMEKQARDLEEELEGALARFTIDRESLSRYVGELRTLARSLESSARSSNVNVQQLRDSIELLSASIQAKTKMISRDADTSKARTRLRRLRRDESSRLSRLLIRYEELTGTSVSVGDCITGQITWEAANGDEPDLRKKRLVCDLFMRLSRTKEEIDILKAEGDRLEARRSDLRLYMNEQVGQIDNLLATPISERPPLGTPSTRYELVHPSDGVLSGLRAFFLESSASL